MSKALYIAVAFILMLPLAGVAQAQSDSTTYERGFRFREGIYLSINDFKANQPIPKASIISEHYKQNDPEFIEKVCSKRFVQYRTDSDTVARFRSNDIWGFSNGTAVYIYINQSYIRIMIIGAICHFTDPNAASRTESMYSGPTGVTHGANDLGNTQYILDFKTCTIVPFGKKELENIFQRDESLMQEYKKFKGKKREKIYIFMNKFNKRNPIKFPTQDRL